MDVSSLTSVISTLCPEKSNSSPERERNTPHISHSARLSSSFCSFYTHTQLFTIGFPTDGALVESHDVLRQGPRLVAEDVFDLSKFLVERGGPRLGGSVTLGVVHLPIPVDVEAVPQSDDLHADTKTHKGLRVKTLVQEVHSSQ